MSTPEGTRYNWRLVSLFVYVVVLVVLGIASRRRDRSLVSDVPRHSGVRWLRQFAVQDGKNRQIAISADGSHVAAAVRSEAGLTIQIWSTADGRLRDCWPVPDWTPSALALSANGQFAACGLFRRRPDDKAWEAGVIVLNHPGNATGIDARIAAGEQVIASLAFSPDASRLAILAPTRLAVHDAPDWRQTIVLKPDAIGADCVAFSPDGKSLASATDRDVKVLDLPSQKWRGQWKEPYGVHSVAFSPDGKQLAAIVNDAPATVWNLATSKPVAKLPIAADEAGFISMAGLISFTKSGGKLLTFRTRDDIRSYGTPPAGKASEGSVESWDLHDPQSAIVLIGPTAKVQTAVFCPTAGLLATAGAEGDAVITLWDLSDMSN